jgi:hypothetical protein
MAKVLLAVAATAAVGVAAFVLTHKKDKDARKPSDGNDASKGEKIGSERQLGKSFQAVEEVLEEKHAATGSVVKNLGINEEARRPEGLPEAGRMAEAENGSNGKWEEETAIGLVKADAPDNQSGQGLGEKTQASGERQDGFSLSAKPTSSMLGERGKGMETGEAAPESRPTVGASELSTASVENGETEELAVAKALPAETAPIVKESESVVSSPKDVGSPGKKSVSRSVDGTALTGTAEAVQSAAKSSPRPSGKPTRKSVGAGSVELAAAQPASVTGVWDDASVSEAPVEKAVVASHPSTTAKGDAAVNSLGAPKAETVKSAGKTPGMAALVEKKFPTASRSPPISVPAKAAESKTSTVAAPQTLAEPVLASPVEAGGKSEEPLKTKTPRSPPAAEKDVPVAPQTAPAAVVVSSKKDWDKDADPSTVGSKKSPPAEKKEVSAAPKSPPASPSKTGGRSAETPKTEIGWSSPATASMKTEVPPQSPPAQVTVTPAKEVPAARKSPPASVLVSPKRTWDESAELQTAEAEKSPPAAEQVPAAPKSPPMSPPKTHGKSVEPSTAAPVEGPPAEKDVPAAPKSPPASPPKTDKSTEPPKTETVRSSPAAADVKKEVPAASQKTPAPLTVSPKTAEGKTAALQKPEPERSPPAAAAVEKEVRAAPKSPPVSPPKTRGKSVEPPTAAPMEGPPAAEKDVPAVSKSLPASSPKTMEAPKTETVRSPPAAVAIEKVPAAPKSPPVSPPKTRGNSVEPPTAEPVEGPPAAKKDIPAVSKSLPASPPKTGKSIEPPKTETVTIEKEVPGASKILSASLTATDGESTEPSKAETVTSPPVGGKGLPTPPSSPPAKVQGGAAGTGGKSGEPLEEAAKSPASVEEKASNPSTVGGGSAVPTSGESRVDGAKGPAVKEEFPALPQSPPAKVDAAPNKAPTSPQSPTVKSTTPETGGKSEEPPKAEGAATPAEAPKESSPPPATSAAGESQKPSKTDTAESPSVGAPVETKPFAPPQNAPAKVATYPAATAGKREEPAKVDPQNGTAAATPLEKKPCPPVGSKISTPPATQASTTAAAFYRGAAAQKKDTPPPPSTMSANKRSFAAITKPPSKSSIPAPPAVAASPSVGSYADMAKPASAKPSKASPASPPDDRSRFGFVAKLPKLATSPPASRSGSVANSPKPVEAQSTQIGFEPAKPKTSKPLSSSAASFTPAKKEAGPAVGQLFGEIKAKLEEGEKAAPAAAEEPAPNGDVVQAKTEVGVAETKDEHSKGQVRRKEPLIVIGMFRSLYKVFFLQVGSCLTKWIARMYIRSFSVLWPKFGLHVALDAAVLQFVSVISDVPSCGMSAQNLAILIITHRFQ